MDNPNKRGGPRKGSGAKPKYNEETKTFGVRCPISKIDELKLIIKSKLSKWVIKQRLTILLVRDICIFVFEKQYTWQQN